MDPSAAEHSRNCLEHIIRILQDESHASAPHLCVGYAGSIQIYKAATDLAVSSSDEGIVRGALGLLNTLVDSEEGIFLDEPRFAITITTFTKRLLDSGLLSADTEALLFEVLFGIAAKLKLQPQYLRRWFKPAIRDGEGTSRIGAQAPADSQSPGGDFPLFYLLLDHVHHDGRVGEFARTGLLYIIESSARSDGLEKWIVESDMATLMASGLGALYSQLSRSALPCVFHSATSLILPES